MNKFKKFVVYVSGGAVMGALTGVEFYIEKLLNLPRAYYLISGFNRYEQGRREVIEALS